MAAHLGWVSLSVCTANVFAIHCIMGIGIPKGALVCGQFVSLFEGFGDFCYACLGNYCAITLLPPFLGGSQVGFGGLCGFGSFPLFYILVFRGLYARFL